jgi:hypothetical protein
LHEFFLETRIETIENQKTLRSIINAVGVLHPQGKRRGILFSIEQID